MNWYTVILAFVQELVKQKFSTKLILALVGIYAVYLIEQEVVIDLIKQQLIPAWAGGACLIAGIVAIGFVVSAYIKARSDQEPIIYGSTTTTPEVKNG